MPRLVFLHKFSVLIYTSAECSTSQSYLKALASLVAVFLTGTFGPLLTVCRNRWKNLPTYLPRPSCLSSPPVGWTSSWLDCCSVVWYNCMSPDDPSLVGSTFRMLLEQQLWLVEKHHKLSACGQRDPALPRLHQLMHLICRTSAQQTFLAFEIGH